MWIRQQRWRVERARRERSVVRLDVAGRPGRVTFLAPFDRAIQESAGGKPRWVRPRQFLARLAGVAARTFSHRTLEAIAGASVDVLAFQLEPAIAVISGARRVLIADEVGLGKTIQAGIVLRELQRRSAALRALIVVPAGLRGQWAAELRSHFHLEVRHGDADSMVELAASAARSERVWDRAGVWIASIDYLKQPHVLGAACGRAWDVLVLDEAHGICGDTDRHAAAVELAGRSRQVLLLTATPHDGDPTRFDRLLHLGKLPLDNTEMVVFRRTRTDVGLPVTRRVRWRLVQPSSDERRVLDLLTAFESAVLRNAHAEADQARLLLLSVFRKRALSTMGAFVVSLERRLSWLESHRADADPTWQPRFAFEGDEDGIGQDERQALVADSGLRSSVERSWLRRLRDAARRAASSEHKVRYLERLLRRTSERVAVFTEFRDSLEVLRRQLGGARRTAALHGGLSSQEQTEQLDSFTSGRTSLLLATDVASQGLNLQSRCRLVINLELPWNPARVEQRAGRVDRIGQARPVRVELLVSAHPAESGLLARLVRRTLAARDRLGPDALPAVAPDEAAIRAHLLRGADLPPAPLVAPRLTFCTRWARHARFAARTLIRKRALAGLWRSDVHLRSFFAGSIDRLEALHRLAGEESLLFFSVPIVDGSCTTIERRLVTVRVPRELCGGALSPETLAATCRLLTKRLEARIRRLRRLRAVEAAEAATRERALARTLRRAWERPDWQPGLFDRRAVRSFHSAEQAIAEIDRELDERLVRFGHLSVVSAAEPVLLFAALRGRRT